MTKEEKEDAWEWLEYESGQQQQHGTEMETPNFIPQQQQEQADTSAAPGAGSNKSGIQPERPTHDVQIEEFVRAQHRSIKEDSNEAQ